ncbi:MAG: hypothetical protein WCI27_06255 [Candidatus Omnitrophota bacterium]
MNCQDVQELLLTDFIDHQVNPDIQNKVNVHLKGCVVCRDFLGAVMKVDANVKEAPLTQGPAPHVWDRISHDIQCQPGSFFDQIEGWWADFSGGFRPVWGYGSLVAATLVFLVVAMPLLVHRQQSASTADGEYLLQLVYADDDNGDGTEGDLVGSGFVVDHLL